MDPTCSKVACLINELQPSDQPGVFDHQDHKNKWKKKLAIFQRQKVYIVRSMIWTAQNIQMELTTQKLYNILGVRVHQLVVVVPLPYHNSKWCCPNFTTCIVICAPIQKLGGRRFNCNLFFIWFSLIWNGKNKLELYINKHNKKNITLMTLHAKLLIKTTDSDW